MKFTIDTQLLKDSVSIVSRASSSSNVSPILENILIDVQSDRVRFVANNTEFAIEKVITEKVEIESEGSFTMSTRFLSSYVSLQTSETVTIEHVKGDSLKFSTQSSKTEMKGLDAKKFPPLPTFTDGQPFKVNSSELKKAFNHTIFSVSSPDVRPTLAGVCLALSGDTVDFVSTDSLRLSVYSIKNTVETTDSVTLTIPTKTAMELSNILPENTEVELFFSEKQLRIIFDNVSIYSQLLQGVFPNYNAFFPKTFSTRGIVLRREIITALKQANLVCLKDKHKTRIVFDHEKGIEIIVEDAEVGTGSMQVTASVEGNNAKVGINSAFLIEVLNVIRDDYVSIEFETTISPVIIRGMLGGTPNTAYRHICMPVKI